MTALLAKRLGISIQENNYACIVADCMALLSQKKNRDNGIKNSQGAQRFW